MEQLIPTKALVKPGMAEEALQELEQAYESDDDQGPEIQEKLASIAERMKKGNLAEGKLKEKMDRQKRPANCTLNVPKVNPEIWAMMDHVARSIDLRLRVQKEQQMLLKASCALAAKVANTLVLNATEGSKEQLKETTDALALQVLKTSHELSVDRRGGKL